MSIPSQSGTPVFGQICLHTSSSFLSLSCLSSGLALCLSVFGSCRQSSLGSSSESGPRLFRSRACPLLLPPVALFSIKEATSPALVTLIDQPSTRLLPRKLNLAARIKEPFYLVHIPVNTPLYVKSRSRIPEYGSSRVPGIPTSKCGRPGLQCVCPLPPCPCRREAT